MAWLAKSSDISLRAKLTCKRYEPVAAIANRISAIPQKRLRV